MTDIMTRSLPWLIEEKLDDARIVRRSAELCGGCGDSEEVHQRKPVPGSFARWYKKHCRCGEHGATQKPGYADQIRAGYR